VPLHVSSITCSSSGGATQTALGILGACCVSWLHQDPGAADWLYWYTMIHGKKCITLKYLTDLDDKN
jgi:hypothetical protein